MPAEWTIRAPRPDDEPALLELVNAHGRAMWGEDVAGATEVHQWLTDPASEEWLAELSDGRLAAFGQLEDPAVDHSLLWGRITLHPELGTDELGDELFDVVERRAAELGAADAVLRASCAAPDERIAALYRRRGLGPVRHFFRMIAELDEPPQQPVWPDGLELRPVGAGDHEAVFIADEEAFQDHWGYVRVAFDTWAHWMTGGAYDPSLWFVAYDGDEIAGYAICQPEEGGDPALGWVEVLGVRRQWRRRGLALALLLHAFGEFHRRGHTRVGLGVDTENTTGAVGLYEKAGMRPVRQFDAYEKAL
ncbi:MAG: N-acetyltransferase family protein [Gaiellaceae bacterium]